MHIVLVVLCVGSPLKGLADDQGSDLDQFFKEIQQVQTTCKYQAEQTIYAFSLHKSIVARFLVMYSYPYKKRERIDGTPEARVILLEDGKYLWSYLPSRKLVVKKPLRSEMNSLPPHSNEEFELIKKNYFVLKRGPVPSSNVTCHILEFVPKQLDRPRREIWFEKDSKIPIRIYIYSREGRPAYISELNNLQWDPKLESDTFHLKVPQGTKVYEITEQANLTLEQAQRLLQRQILLPTRIPSGFSPFNILFRSEGERKRVQVVYSDGLSSFSVFQESNVSPSEKVTEKSSVSSGILKGTPDIHRYGQLNILSYDFEDQRAILIGDINEIQLLDAARSFSGLE